MADIQHASIADADRHEPKGASTASANDVLTANGDGTTSFKSVNYGNVSGTPAPAVPLDGSAGMTGPLKLMSYTLATLPSVTTYNKYLIVVTDASAGPALCISNGTNWIDIRTNAAVA